MVDPVIEIHKRDQHPGNLIPRAGQTSAGRVRGVVPRSLVAGRVDFGNGIQDQAALLGVLLLPGDAVGEGELLAPLLVGLHHPGVVGAFEIVDAAVICDVACARVRMVGIGEDVAVLAAHGARTAEAAVGATPGAPFGGADRAARETVREGRPLVRAVLADPFRRVCEGFVGRLYRVISQ